MTESVEQTNARNVHVDMARGEDFTGVVVVVRGAPCWCVDFETRNPNAVGVRANCPACGGTGVDSSSRVMESVAGRNALLRDYRSHEDWPPALVHAVARSLGYERHTDLIASISTLQELIYERTQRASPMNLVRILDSLPTPTSSLEDLVWWNVPAPDAPAASHAVRGNEHGRSFRKPKNQDRCNVCGRRMRSGEGRCPGCGARR